MICPNHAATGGTPSPRTAPGGRPSPLAAAGGTPSPLAAAGGTPRRLTADPRRHGRLHARARALLAGLLLAVLVALPALAIDQLPRLRDRVTDQAGVLSSTDVDAINAAVKQLEDQQNVQLFVAFVDSTGVEAVTDFTSATAKNSSLGGNDALLLVAIQDRSDALWVGDLVTQVTDQERDAILADAVEPKLRAGDFGGAGVAAADALGRAMAGDILPPVPAGGGATAAPGEATPPGDVQAAPGLNITAILAAVLLVGGAVLVLRALWDQRARAKARRAAYDSLSQQANRALLATDEALKDAANDVEFAAAQWGDAEVVAYRAAITTASAELRAAFQLRQRLDDADPETPAEQEQMLQEILGRTGNARKLLDEQEQRFDQLRDLEHTAPAQLDQLATAITALRARRDTAAAAFDRIAAAYAPSAVTSVAGNATEADKALTAASTEVDRGRGVVAAKPSEGVIALRRAQDGVARATRLIEAIERLATRLDEAAARLPAELDAAAADVETARSAIASGQHIPARIPAAVLPPPAAGAPTVGASPAPAVAVAPPPAAVPPGAGASGAATTTPTVDPNVALANAQRLLADARRVAEARPLDPLAALERATQANQAADAIISGLREAEAQRVRRLQVAESAVTSARGHVQRASDYITTRRHGVGREARTRAAEAELRLDDAERLAASDPDSALAAAKRATQLADEAYRLATSEFEGWDQGGGPIAGPYARGASPEAQVIGAVLGGVLGGILSGGGRGAGWGGSPWGGPTGGGGGFGLPGGGGGGGIGLPGPFGGGGGGGGRVSGGRW